MGRFLLGGSTVEFEIQPDYTVEDFAAFLAEQTGKPVGWVNGEPDETR